MPTVYTVDQVLADPIQLNSRLGTYTNFVNLLDLCGLAVPASMRADGAPSGITLLAPAGRDAALATIGRAFHADTGLPLGATKRAHPPLAVASSELRGGEVAARGRRRASLRHAAQRRAADAQRALHRGDDDHRRLSALCARRRRCAEAGHAARRGRRGHGDHGRSLGADGGGIRPFVAAIPPPLSIGNVRLAGGGFAKGFLVEATAVNGARDISSFGGWRAYMAGKG